MAPVLLLRHADGLDPMGFSLTAKQQQDMFAAAIFTHVNRARRYNSNFLKPGGVAELTLTWRDVHQDKLLPLPVVVRLATQQMVGPEGEACSLTSCRSHASVALLQLQQHYPLPTLLDTHTQSIHSPVLSVAYMLRVHIC